MRTIIALFLIMNLSIEVLSSNISTIDVSTICETIINSREQFSSWSAITHDEYIRLKLPIEESIDIDNGKRIFVSKYSTEYTILCSKEKLRVEKQSISTKKDYRSVFHDTRIFDGERTFSYKISQFTENHLASPKAAVYSGSGVGHQGNPVDLSYGVLCYSWNGEVTRWYRLEGFLSGKTKAGQVTAIGNEEVDGLSCTVFTSDEVDGVTLKVWIAPERMFCLKKAEITTPTERIIVKNYYEKNGDLWILKERVEESFDRLKGDKLHKIRMTTKEFVPHINIADSNFVMKFPDGIDVRRFDQQERIPYKQW